MKNSTTTEICLVPGTNYCEKWENTTQTDSYFSFWYLVFQAALILAVIFLFIKKRK